MSQPTVQPAPAPAATSTARQAGQRPFAVLVGLTALVILLQGLWAGIFLEHDGQRDAADSWINVHAWGAHTATALAVLAVIVALVKLRARKDLLFGSIALLALVVVEAYIGGLISDDSKDTLTAIHVPLAMATMGAVIWLALRTRRQA